MEERGNDDPAKMTDPSQERRESPVKEEKKNPSEAEGAGKKQKHRDQTVGQTQADIWGKADEY